MALTLNGSANTIGGLAVGGLPNGIVDTDMIADDAVTAPKASGGRSLLDVDLWRLTSNFAGDADPVSSNLERSDDSPYEKIGSGMSVSSGIWTFPNTGVWRVESLREGYRDDDDREFRSFISATEDDGSNWHVMSENATFLKGLSTNTHVQVYTYAIVDVADTTQSKVKFKFQCDQSGTSTIGSSTRNRTTFTFTRLGDT